jgi:hypothetical protein
VDLDQLMDEAIRAGLTIARRNGHTIIRGPVGTEQLALQLAAALEAAERSIDEPYVFGRPYPTLVKPWPFRRAEYSSLVELRRRFASTTPADSPTAY